MRDEDEDEFRWPAPGVLAGRRPAHASVPPTPSALPKADLARVLVVDDDGEMLNMLSLALRDSYEVTTASNGMEAIERLVDYTPDLMLIDIMMPKMNGYQLLQSVRRNPYFSHTPVIVFFGQVDPTRRGIRAQAGGNAVPAQALPDSRPAAAIGRDNPGAGLHDPSQAALDAGDPEEGFRRE